MAATVPKIALIFGLVLLAQYGSAAPTPEPCISGQLCGGSGVGYLGGSGCCRSFSRLGGGSFGANCNGPFFENNLYGANLYNPYAYYCPNFCRPYLPNFCAGTCF